MLVINNDAELRKINLRVEAHGDAMVRAIDLRFISQDVDAARLDSAIGDFDRLYDRGQPQLQEIYPLIVRHKIENTEVKIKGGRKTITLKGCDVNKVRITPRVNGRCDIDFTVQMVDYTDGILDHLSKWQSEIVNVDVVERQLELDVSQGEAVQE